MTASATKRCMKCERTKPLSDFYKHPKMADGHLNKCKDCAKRDVRGNRLANIEHYTMYDNQRAFDPERVAARDEYAKTEAYRESHGRSTKAYRERNPERYKAQTAVNNAVRDGKLIKPARCGCGGPGKVQAYHDDYSKPLEVRWMCHVCHEREHHGERTRHA